MKFFKVMCAGVVLSFGGMALTQAADEVKEVKVAAAEIKPAEAKPVVQLAILLDTSGSMDGLIEQAKSQLWKVVNEFALSKRDGKTPIVQVALYEYGKQTVAAQDGFVRQILPLTTDLDKVSEELFALKTNGGEEYCGWAIKAATEQLQWSGSARDFKAIFICGNEPFTQGSVDYKTSCSAAIAKGIIVNTIHCGAETTGVDQKWLDGAKLADGKFLNIDQNQTVAHIAAPQDAEIERLGVELNKTYIAYGVAGKDAAKRQMEQDANAKKAGQGALQQRAVCKASGNYQNGAWDIVDALKENTKKLEELKDEELPEEMRKMTLDERRKFVAEKKASREKLQKDIEKLNGERSKFVAEELKKKTAEAGNTLDAAIIQTVREQSAKKDFKFE